MRFPPSTLLLIAAFLCTGLAQAQDAPGLQSSAKQVQGQESEARKGWFWYLDPKEKEKKKEEVVEAPAPVKETKAIEVPAVVVGIGNKVDPRVEELLEDPCASAKSWKAACGFIDPGSDFEFQAKQRDELLQQMSLRPDVPEAVEAVQRYMKWVVSKASQAANMWYFNLVQKPDLDPTVKNPISEFGLALASRVTKASEVEYFRMIREEGGLLFFFTRSDCIYCHEQAPMTIRVARTMGLRLINVPLDGVCIPGIPDADCAKDAKIEQAKFLDLQTVPTLYLYVPDATWIRLSSGLSSDTTTIANTVNFFSAYRAALLNGVDNGDGVRPSVSFNPDLKQVTGTANADGSAKAGVPTQARMMEMLGMRKALAASVQAGAVAAQEFRQEQPAN